jgi:hypothetical protein
MSQVAVAILQDDRLELVLLITVKYSLIMKAGQDAMILRCRRYGTSP